MRYFAQRPFHSESPCQKLRACVSVCVRMKALLCACSIAVFLVSADGNVRNDTVLCAGIEDFELCLEEWTCKVNISRCYCKSETPFCRCNNHIDEFYVGSTCSVKFTTTTFALVATLPGIALVLLVGLGVHLIHWYTKSSRRHGRQSQGKFPAEEFSPYASDMKPHPKVSPPGPALPRMDVSMASTGPPKPYSGYDHIQSPAYAPPAKGLPHPAYGAPGNPPLQAPLRASFRTPASPPYRQAGMDQVLSNPYAERGPSSPNPYDDDDDERMAPPSSSYLAFPRPRISGM